MNTFTSKLGNCAMTFIRSAFVSGLVLAACTNFRRAQDLDQQCQPSQLEHI